jgi:hypothetical protein
MIASKATQEECRFMPNLFNDYSAGLFSAQPAPCISLYQPTHQQHPDNQQDPIRFRNLLGRIEASLAHSTAKAYSDELLAPLRELADDREFWQHTRDGLAILRSKDLLRVYRLERPVPEPPHHASDAHPAIHRSLSCAGNQL